MYFIWSIIGPLALAILHLQAPVFISSLLCSSEAHKHLHKPFGCYWNHEAYKPHLQSRCYCGQLQACKCLFQFKFCSCHPGAISTHLVVQRFLFTCKFCFWLPCHSAPVPTLLRPMGWSYPTPLPAIYVLFLPAYVSQVPATNQQFQILAIWILLMQPWPRTFLADIQSLHLPARSYF